MLKVIFGYFVVVGNDTGRFWETIWEEGLWGWTEICWETLVLLGFGTFETNGMWILC